ncbi:MAG: outer membrane protein assembly factor BamD [Prevotella sp.]|nr:outer membrane protein assembly factor BamD [Prevotella sp.]
MKKSMFFAVCTLLLMSSCAGEYTRVLKSPDSGFRYEYAKQQFAEGKYSHVVVLLQDLVTVMKGGDNAQESLYMLAMAQYMSNDFEAASETFKKYGTSYPKGLYAEKAAFYVGQSLFASAPEPRLDQTPTIGAINAYQRFLDLYPDSKLRQEAQDKLYELQDKLIMKEYLSAKLYYNLGGYFGNINANNESNYSSCIITAENALKTYPFTHLRENFALLIMKSKFQLAENSSEEKRMERYRDAEDECYGFLNEFPDSKETSTAQRYIAKCKKYTKD